MLTQLSGKDGCKIPELLLGTHDMQIHIGCDAEIVKDLIDHFTVLRGGYGKRTKELGGFKLPNHRCQFDGLRTGSNDDGYGSFHSNREFLGCDKLESKRPTVAALEDLGQFLAGEHSA